ncbi:MAG: selenide, water dikinase SelD [Candidatus Binatia bacterium]
MGAEDLVQVLRNVAPLPHPWVDTTVGAMEDAALLRPPAGPPLVFTVDFVTPIVDDPAAFGAIAAANALSDVYAMGGEPQAALAICGFPSETLPLDVLERIFRGGRDKAAEAGCAIVGGHTIKDAELKYGLCVLGTTGAHVLTQTGAQPGDVLVLTKPLGTGIVSQAIKREAIAAADLAAAVVVMTTLNKGAKDAALAAGAHAATDVTGFGFLGHLHNLLVASGVAARIDVAAVPVLDGVPALIAAGHVPGGSRNNLAHVEPACAWDGSVSESDRLVLADAQTSGGLLIAVPPAGVATLLRELERCGAPARAVVGTLTADTAGRIHVARA